jgi:TolA-binding protein
MANKEAHKNDLLEKPEAIQERLVHAESWIEQNSKLVIGIAVAFLLIVGGYFAFTLYKANQNQAAQKEMFQAQYYFEQDSLELALNGDGNNLGFIQIIDDYKFSDAAKLANYYVGAIYLKQGKFEAARLYLQDFSSNDLLIQARAYSLIGDTYMEEGNYESAAKFYSKAGNYEPNKFFSPSYLMKEALAHELANQKDKAVKVYDQIIEKYWDSSEYQNARKYKAKLTGNS